MEKVTIRTRCIIGDGGQTAVAHTVYCPFDHTSKLLVDCEVCERCAELTPESSFLLCALAERPAGPPSIGEVMQGDIVCVTPDLSAAALSELLLERRLGAVPVVDLEGHPIGVASTGDLLRAQSTAGELMTPVAFTLAEESPLADAIKLMSVEQVQRLPVVDRDGRVVGVLSALDVLRWLDG